MALKFLFHVFSGDFQFVNVPSTTTTPPDNRILNNDSGGILFNGGGYMLHN